MTVGQVTEPLTVGQLAARAAVRTDMIRYYEREGLLPAPRHTEGEHRRYGPADLDRLLFIRGAERLGLRLAEIRELLAVRDTGKCACEPAEALLRRHVAEIGTEIERLLRPPGKDRRRLRSRIGDIYRLRSKVVHGVEAGLQDVAQASQEAASLAADALRVLITDRPDLVALASAERSLTILME